ELTCDDIGRHWMCMVRVRGVAITTPVDRPQALTHQALTNTLMTDTLVLFTQFLHNAKPPVAALACRVNGLDLRIQYGVGQASEAGSANRPLAIARARYLQHPA